jgi:predicted dehydrogenase
MLLASAAALGGAGLAAGAGAGGEQGAGRVFRVGVISAAVRGKPQPRNGHTWHFAQYLHPAIDLDAFCAAVDPGTAKFFRSYVRNPKFNFDQLPFPDTRLTHYFDADPEAAADFAKAFPGVRVARSVEDMAEQVDAVWLGDASGYGEDHFGLVAPGLRRGLPTFCDKPIGGTPAGTRKILNLARRHGAPLMSSSILRHEWGTAAALRMRDAGDFGTIRHVVASLQGGYTDDGWLVYGQHPAWMVVTLMGPGAEAVSLYAQGGAGHALVTYPDRPPASVWYGRPGAESFYNHTEVHFERRRYEYTPAIEGDFWYGHHYEMFRMAAAFREMVKTRREPVTHREILEVTAIIHAAAKSRRERSRLVRLAEVL